MNVTRKHAAGLFCTLFLSIPLVADIANAECMRLVPKPMDHRPDPDGPGSWGPLQDTLTLGCLSFVDTVVNEGQLNAVLEDETGLRHVLRPGDFMGENAGQLLEVTESRLTIEQVVRGPDGQWMQTERYMFPTRSNR